MTKVIFLISSLVITLSGCIENPAYVTQERSDKVAEYILKDVPNIQHSSNVVLDGKVELLGYDIQADKPKPGSKVEITWYWKVKQDPGPGWRLFTHSIGSHNNEQFNRDMTGPVRQSFQPEHWKSGMIIKDYQSFNLPKDWVSESVEFRVGIWKGPDRMSGNKNMDDANRIKGPSLKVSVKPPAPPKPPTSIAYASSTPKIDGKFQDEAAWASATALSAFTNTMKGTAVKEKTDVKIMWDEKNLYVAFFAQDTNLKSSFAEHDDELWREDAFEVFVDPQGNKKDYYEIQVSPKGIVFDSYLPKYRKNQNDWSSNTVVSVVAKGTVNNDADTDEGWYGEMAIPFESMKYGSGIPPKEGDVWALNFFRVNNDGDKTSYSAWSPPMRGDFHTLNKFGPVVFSKKNSVEESAKTEKTDKGASSVENKSSALDQKAQKTAPSKDE